MCRASEQENRSILHKRTSVLGPEIQFIQQGIGKQGFKQLRIKQYPVWRSQEVRFKELAVLPVDTLKTISEVPTGSGNKQDFLRLLNDSHSYDSGQIHKKHGRKGKSGGWIACICLSIYTSLLFSHFSLINRIHFSSCNMPYDETYEDTRGEQQSFFP